MVHAKMNLKRGFTGIIGYDRLKLS